MKKNENSGNLIQIPENIHLRNASFFFESFFYFSTVITLGEIIADYTTANSLILRYVYNRDNKFEEELLADCEEYLKIIRGMISFKICSWIIMRITDCVVVVFSIMRHIHLKVYFI